jgi:hypothetical protein
LGAKVDEMSVDELTPHQKIKLKTFFAKNFSFFITKEQQQFVMKHNRWKKKQIAFFSICQR